MEIAPLIHSRTFCCDFNQNFAVRAGDIDVSWAMKKILLAMNNVDILNGIRRMVAYKNNICIAGIACSLRYFAKNYLNDTDAENYFQDNAKRDVKIFLGCAFKGDKNEIPDINYSTLWEMFKENLAPVWESPTAETVIVNYKNCASRKINPANLEKFFVADESIDEKLFEQCMAERKNLCTNADQSKIISSGEFEIISTTQSLINKFKAEAEKKTSTVQSQQTQSTQRREISHEKSNSPIPIIIAAVIIILVILFLLMN